MSNTPQSVTSSNKKVTKKERMSRSFMRAKLAAKALLLPILNGGVNTVEQPKQISTHTVLLCMTADTAKAFEQCSHVRLVGLKQGLSDDNAEVVTVVHPLGKVIVDEVYFWNVFGHTVPSSGENGSVAGGAA